MVKKIIESENNSQVFALLLINTNKEGYLRYYQSNAEGSEFIEIDYVGVYVSIIDKLVSLDSKFCLDNGYVLWSY